MTLPPAPSCGPTWFDDLDTVPPTRPAPHPLQHRTALAAWRHVAAEPVLAQRYLHLPHPHSPGDLAVFSLVGASAYWTGWEAQAGVPPVWDRPAAYTPTPFAGYGAAGLCDPATAAITIRLGLEQAAAWDAPALVLPHLPAHITANAPASDADLHVNTAYSAVVHPDGVAGVLAALGNRRTARGFGRELRRAGETGLHLETFEGAALTAARDEFAGLAGQVDERHGTAKFGPDVIRALLRTPGALLLGARHGDRLVGAFLCFRFGDTLYASTTGLDYTRLRDLHTYTWLMAATFDYAARTGAARIDFGRSNHTVKQRWELDRTELHTLVYLTDPGDARTRAALARMAQGLHNPPAATPSSSH
ncbi:GNAT family N-acetyltransferase [Streptacidiphilus sp. MAP5-52]|uniref:GNAT family N-acetyltransferase n=1 Tax=Streptacidiphilus sp. MAP5-52 TaxID=3156267 RepID=UPI003518B755